MSHFIPQTYVPTPDEIAAKCREIREGWTLNERRRRAIGDKLQDEFPLQWTPPQVDTTLLRPTATSRIVDV